MFEKPGLANAAGSTLSVPAADARAPQSACASPVVEAPPPITGTFQDIYAKYEAEWARVFNA